MAFICFPKRNRKQRSGMKCQVCLKEGNDRAPTALTRPTCGCKPIYVCSQTHAKKIILSTFQEVGACPNHRSAKIAEVIFLTPVKPQNAQNAPKPQKD